MSHENKRNLNLSQTHVELRVCKKNTISMSFRSLDRLQIVKAGVLQSTDHLQYGIEEFCRRNTTHVSNKNAIDTICSCFLRRTKQRNFMKGQDSIPISVQCTLPFAFNSMCKYLFQYMVSSVLIHHLYMLAKYLLV